MRKGNNLATIQPLTLIADGFLLCSCGDRATKVTGKLTSSNANSLTRVQTYCDECYEIENRKRSGRNIT